MIDQLKKIAREKESIHETVEQINLEEKKTLLQLMLKNFIYGKKQLGSSCFIFMP